MPPAPSRPSTSYGPIRRGSVSRSACTPRDSPVRRTAAEGERIRRAPVRRSHGGNATPVLRPVVPLRTVPDELLDRAHETLDVLVRGARAEAHADGVEGLLAGRGLGGAALALGL